MNRLEYLYKKSWYHWRGKAGAYAKSNNKELLKLSNNQKLRYFNKWADYTGVTSEFKLEYIKARLV